MSQFESVFVQQVEAGQNALLETDVIKSRCVHHRAGSGLICLETSGCDCRPARYRVFVKANIDIPTGGTVDPISLALSLNGEAVQSSVATVTPAAAGYEIPVALEEIVCACACSPHIAGVYPKTLTIGVCALSATRVPIC